MTFERLYRASQYVTLLLATLLLSIDAGLDNRFAMLYPIAVGAASVLAFVTVDRDPRRGLPRDVANYLGVLAFAFALLEYYNDTNTLLLAIGHFLVYIQIIKSFLPKTVVDDWWLLGIGLVEAVIGVYTSQSDAIGALLLCWALASLWTFGLFFLRRESLRGGPPPGVTITPAADRTDPYRGLLNASFVTSMLLIAATTLVLGGLIFMVMPRWSARGLPRFGSPPQPKHLTGFTGDVKLGQMGEILESDTVVMSVEFSDEDRRVVTPEPEVLLRGITLAYYDADKKEWQRDETEFVMASQFRPRWPDGTPVVFQRYKLEPTDSDVLFGLRPILRVRGPVPNEMLVNLFDGSIYRRDVRDQDTGGRRPNKYDYTVVSRTADTQVQPEEKTVSGLRKTEKLLGVPDRLVEPFRAITGPVVGKLRPKEGASPGEVEKAHRAMAVALLNYLRDGDFTYSLKMTTIDQRIDPVLDFLRNRKEGHCEYFASALTLLCRVEGIPARLVNGFKGGDWDALGGVLHVREKHAHSWVEVLANDAGTPRWDTLDPTPSRERAESVARVGGGAAPYRFLANSIRSFWTFQVAGFDADYQERAIYAPIRAFFEMVKRGFAVLGGWSRDAARWFYFEDPGQFFSVRGFFVSVMAMLLLVALARAATWLHRRLFGRKGRGRDGGAAVDPGLAFYHRLLKILEPFGLERPDAETPREFARRAAVALEGRPAASAHTALPPAVVDLFYAKRFGARELEAESLRDLDARLAALEASLAKPG